MKFRKSKIALFAVLMITLLMQYACRKKEERYEGNYIGTERYTVIDSGETEYSLDTTYAQIIEITAIKNRYRIRRIANEPNNEIYEIDKNSIENNEYLGEASLMRFVGDSLFLDLSNFSDYFDIPDSKHWEFKGKRN